jgi:hypothetical protein
MQQPLRASNPAPRPSFPAVQHLDVERLELIALLQEVRDLVDLRDGR